MKRRKLSYLQWQRRNSEYFNAASKQEQKQLRTQGYKNRGWTNVKSSWRLVKKSLPKNSLVISMMGHHAKRFERGEISADEFDELTINLMSQICNNRDRVAKQRLSKFQRI